MHSKEIWGDATCITVIIARKDYEKNVVIDNITSNRDGMNMNSQETKLIFFWWCKVNILIAQKKMITDYIPT